MGTMTFESQGLYIVAIYIWLPPASYVVFLTTLVAKEEYDGYCKSMYIEDNHP